MAGSLSPLVAAPPPPPPLFPLSYIYSAPLLSSLPPAGLSLGAMPPSQVLHSLSLPTFSASTMQAHSLPLTTPSVLPPLPLPPPPVSGDFLISANFPPIPAKLVQKIRRWEFVELNQLLPDNLVSFPNQDLELGDQKLPRERKKLPPIEDISSWCLAMLLYTATCHATYPHKTGDMLAYMASILQTSSNYPVEACLSYDRVFRAQAHLKPQFNWAGDNTRLWNDKFSGRAAPKLGNSTATELLDTVKFQSSVKPPPKDGELCMGFNLGRCSISACPRPHLCYRCHYSHPLLQCPKARCFLKGKSSGVSNSSQATRGPRVTTHQ